MSMFVFQLEGNLGYFCNIFDIVQYIIHFLNHSDNFFPRVFLGQKLSRWCKILSHKVAYKYFVSHSI